MELLRLKELLSDSGLTGKMLADKTGVTPNTISNIVSGKNFPKPELLLKIAEILNVDIRELFNSTKADNPFNGFVEHKGQVHKIQSIGDIENLLKEVN